MQLRHCAVCMTHNRHFQRHTMGEMPIASYPIQIVAVYLIGPLVESTLRSKYILTAVYFCTGWAEAFPIPSKSNENDWNAFTNGFISRHGCPEVLISDLGSEFTALDFERYLEQLGIEHRTTTPVHPRLPPVKWKIERFNRTIKKMIQKAVNNQPSRLESVLNDALLAYRTSVSTTTGDTPHFLMTGRKLRMPLVKDITCFQRASFWQPTGRFSDCP